MTVKKTKAAKDSTLTRCTVHTRKEIQKLAGKLWKAYPEEHKRIGIRKASAKVAVDALLYWSAMAGELNSGKITSKNNLYAAIRDVSEGVLNE